jgi:hypothetical protein
VIAVALRPKQTKFLERSKTMQMQHLPVRLCLPFLAAILPILYNGIPPTQAQEQQPRSTMQQRLEQIIDVLERADDCGLVEAIIDDGPEILWGGLRPLRSKGELLDTTIAVDKAISEAELKFATALKQYANRGGLESSVAGHLTLRYS